MTKQSVLAKKRRGPAPTGKGVQVVVRWQPEPLDALDQWIARQQDKPTRAEAIRRLVDLGLGGHSALPHKTEKHSSDEKTGKRAK